MLSRIRRYGLRLWHLFGGDAADRDLAREIDAHLALMEDELVRRGVSRQDARRAARIRFGGVEEVKEAQRDARTLRWLVDARQDLNHAVRMFRRAPGFAAVAVFTLALGIGANTVIFSVVDAVVLRKLPVPDPESLVNVRELWPASRPRTDVPYWEFAGLRDGVSSLMTLSAIAVFDRSNLSLADASGAVVEIPRSRVAIVSGNYFPMLRLQPAIGRLLSPEDDKTRDGHPVAVISRAMLERHTESHQATTESALQHSVTINGTRFAIVGVVPEGFTGDWIGRPVDVWVTTMMQGRVMVEAPDALVRPNDYWLRLVARLGPGVTLAQARDALQPVYQQVMRRAAPGASPQTLNAIGRQRMDLEPAVRGFSPQRDAVRGSLAILTGVAAIVLLVVCANVAGLMLSRAAGRQREFAVRLAIGAARPRLARQILTESVLLAVIGAAFGILCAVWAGAALSAALATAPTQMFWAASSWTSFDVHLSGRSLAFTVLLSAIAGVAFGVSPAVRGTRIALGSALSPRTPAADSRGRFPVGTCLVIAQIALALVVFASAALLFRSLVNLKNQDLGFQRGNLLLVFTQPSSTGRQGAALNALWREIHHRLSALPGVVSAAGSNSAILSGSMPAPGPAMPRLIVDGRPPRVTNAPGGRTFITPDYFRTLGVPLVAGREFTEADSTGSQPVIILNETLARFYFDAENPVGRHVRAGSPASPLYEVVGVIGDFERGTPRGVHQPQMLTYFPYRADAAAQMVILCAVLRTHGDATAMAGQVRQELRAIDPSLAVLKIDTVEKQLDDVLSQDRLLAVLAAFFGAVAVLLACLGLYGLVSQMMARRTAEIGVRMALGATRGAVLAMVLRQGVRIAAVGVAIGVPASFVVTRFLAAQLYAVRAGDPAVLAAAALLLIGVTLAASALPAWRASSIDPVVALREG